jgi:hypothetical protein
MKILLIFLISLNFLFNIGCKDDGHSTILLWKHGRIPYTMIGLNPIQAQILLESMFEWQIMTGSSVIFVPKKSGDEKFLTIINDTKNDSTYIEAYSPGLQIMQLNCWSTRRAIRHGLGHVIGLLHEHQRPDRELYIHIEPFSNCSPTAMYQIMVYPDDVYQYDYKKYPYDKQSIMHYKWTDICEHALLNSEGETGSEDISILDAKKVIDMYEDFKEEEKKGIFNNFDEE